MVANVLYAVMKEKITTVLSPIKSKRKRELAGSLRIDLPDSIVPSKNKVLAICCYMADRPNLIENLVKSVREASLTAIDFVVTNNTDVSSSDIVEPYVKYTMPRTPKYRSVNKIVGDLFKPSYDYLMVIDDDVQLPEDFFDKYFTVVRGLDLALSQPALTDGSFRIYPFNRQIKGAIAHLTAFVEIGPVTCFKRDLLRYFSFGNGSPMGWGLDYRWSKVCIDKGLTMGAVDFTPIRHNLRETARHYSQIRESYLMWKYLAKTPRVPTFSREIVGQVVYKKECPEILCERTS